jgi:hypothetical protein
VSERWVGIVVSGDKIVLVDAAVPTKGPLVLQSDQTLSLQGGNRAKAYHVMSRRVEDYVRDNGVTRVVIKESAVSGPGAGRSHLLAAELRGVVMGAAGAACKTDCLAKALISRTFGERKVDEYLHDDGFWASNILGKLKIGSREAAMMLVAARGK